MCVLMSGGYIEICRFHHVLSIDEYATVERFRCKRIWLFTSRASVSNVIGSLLRPRWLCTVDMGQRGYRVVAGSWQLCWGPADSRPALSLSTGASACTRCPAGSFYGSTGEYGLSASRRVKAQLI